MSRANTAINLFTSLALTALVMTTGCSLHRSAPSTHLYVSPMLAPNQELEAFEREADAYAQRLAQEQLSGSSARTSRSSRAGRSTGTSRTSARRATRVKLSAQVGPSPYAQVRASAGYIWTTLHDKGTTLPEDTKQSLTALYRHCQKQRALHFKTPKVGQIVFFHNTFDANDDGRHNDWYTLAAIVTERSGDQLTLRGVSVDHEQRWMLNLKQPKLATQGQSVINSPLRAKRPDDLPFTQYLASALFAGACQP